MPLVGRENAIFFRACGGQTVNFLKGKMPLARAQKRDFSRLRRAKTVYSKGKMLWWGISKVWACSKMGISWHKGRHLVTKAKGRPFPKQLSRFRNILGRFGVISAWMKPFCGFWIEKINRNGTIQAEITPKACQCVKIRCFSSMPNPLVFPTTAKCL